MLGDLNRILDFTDLNRLLLALTAGVVEICAFLHVSALGS